MTRRVDLDDRINVIPLRPGRGAGARARVRVLRVSVQIRMLRARPLRAVPWAEWRAVWTLLSVPTLVARALWRVVLSRVAVTGQSHVASLENLTTY